MHPDKSAFRLEFLAIEPASLYSRTESERWSVSWTSWFSDAQGSSGWSSNPSCSATCFRRLLFKVLVPSEFFFQLEALLLFVARAIILFILIVFHIPWTELPWIASIWHSRQWFVDSKIPRKGQCRRKQAGQCRGALYSDAELELKKSWQQLATVQRSYQ